MPTGVPVPISMGHIDVLAWRGVGRWVKAIASKTYLCRAKQISSTCPAQARSLAMGCAAFQKYAPGGAISIKAEAGL